MKIRHVIRRPKKAHTLWYWQLPTHTEKLTGMTRKQLGKTEGIDSQPTMDMLRDAEEYNREYDNWRKGIEEEGRPKPGTIKWLIREYTKDPAYLELAPKTQDAYEFFFKALGKKLGHFQAKSVTRLVAREFYNRYKDKPRTAMYAVQTCRMLFNFGIRLGVLTDNPFKEMRISKPKPRQLVWTRPEEEVLVAAAYKAKHPSVAHASILAADTGQRRGDILKLAWSNYNGTTIRLRQSKTSAHIEIPCTQRLKTMLDGITRTSTQIIVDEETGKPYRADKFSHLFREIAGGIKDLRKELQFLDLRRTAVVRLAEAGCTEAEIASITGHQIQATREILETYLPRNVVMAGNAIAKLEGKKA